MQALEVDIWSDIACPWCYIGTRRFGAGLARFLETHPDVEVKVVYHSFQLTPDMPFDYPGSEADFLVDHKGVPRSRAQEMLDSVTAVALTEGLRFDFSILRPTNTAKAHELLHYAKARGKQVEVNEALFRARFSEGRHVGRAEELADLASEAGLDREEALSALRDGVHEADVRADLEMAASLGIGGVPFYVMDGKYGLSGAQPPESFVAAMERAVADQPRGRTHANAGEMAR